MSVDATAEPVRPSREHVLDPALVTRLTRRVVGSPSTPRHTTRAPFTGEPIAELPQSTPQDVAEAYARARAAQVAWARTPVHQRCRVLLRYHDLVLDRQAEGLDLVQHETGKARPHAFEELADVALVSRHYGRRAPRYLRTQRHRGLVPGLTRADEVRHPKGVVGIIAPWNYPLTLAVTDALPALAAGNAVVIKPDTQTALTALWAIDLLEQAGLPPGLFQVVLGDGPVIGPEVVDGADYVCFTGSTRTGRDVARRAAARLVGSSLELGGKNAFLVLADADLDRAAEAAVRSCFASSGQLCISTERVLVDQSVYDPFVDRLVGRVRRMRLAAGFGWEVDMGSLVSQRQLDTAVRHVDDAVDKGAEILTGGKPRPDLGPLFFEPTLLAGVTPEMECYAEETFGPVVSVHPFTGEDEAVRLANDSAYGLNASVWTRQVPRGRRLAVRLKAGTVNVNEAYGPSWGSTAAPMGGMRDSGLGRRHGSEGIHKYTEPQTVASQRLLPLGAPERLGQERWARLFTTGLRLLKRSRLG